MFLAGGLDNAFAATRSWSGKFGLLEREIASSKMLAASVNKKSVRASLPSSSLFSLFVDGMRFSCEAMGLVEPSD